MGTCTTCTVYGQEPEHTRGYVCEGCEYRIRNQLRRLVDDYQRLPEALAPGSAGGPKVGGTKDRPIGVRVNVLDLMLPVVRDGGRPVDVTGDNWVTTRDGRTIPAGDQIGHVPIAVVLDSWAREWLETGAPGTHRPVPTVPSLTAWLTNRLPWAAAHHPAMGEFAASLGEVVWQVRAALGDIPTKPQLCDGVPCRQCDMMSLYRIAALNPTGRARRTTADVECTWCGQLYTLDEYDEWVRRLAAHHRQEAS